ncbi:hypothetical protein GCM10017752_56520 [Streptomyces roseoviridis]
MVPGLLGTVGVQDQRLAGQQPGGAVRREVGGEREGAERRQRVADGDGFDATAEAVRAGVAAGEDVDLPVGTVSRSSRVTNSSATGCSGGCPVLAGCSSRARSRRCRPSARSRRRRTPASSGSSWTASRKLPRTATTAPRAASPWPRTSPMTIRTPYGVAAASYRSPPTTAPRDADSWPAATASPSSRAGGGRSSTCCAASATARTRTSSRTSPRRTPRTRTAPTVRNTALVAIRTGSPGSLASGHHHRHATAPAPHTAGATSGAIRRNREPSATTDLSRNIHGALPEARQRPKTLRHTGPPLRPRRFLRGGRPRGDVARGFHPKE